MNIVQDSVSATCDATLRAWELVQVRDVKTEDGRCVEEGRGCFVSTRYAKEHDLNFKIDNTVRRFIDEHACDWVELVPFVDFTFYEPRIGFEA